MARLHLDSASSNIPSSRRSRRCIPFYIIRALGGGLFLAGALIMAFNLWKTVNSAEAAEPAGRRAGAGGVRRDTTMSLWHKHAIFEKNSIVLLIGILIVIAIGGLVEIVPLFYLKSTIEKVDGVRPYTPLELAGRNIYVREGCYLCHSQMIRPLRDEVERYGHYSLAAESMYDHPFQWGSKRTGPDLARVGGKYSDDWHREHLTRSALGGAGIDHAALRLPGADRPRLPPHRREHEGPGRSSAFPIRTT